MKRVILMILLCALTASVAGCMGPQVVDCSTVQFGGEEYSDICDPWILYGTGTVTLPDGTGFSFTCEDGCLESVDPL